MKPRLVLNTVAVIALLAEAGLVLAGTCYALEESEAPKQSANAAGERPTARSDARSPLPLRAGDDIEKPRPISLKVANKIDKIHAMLSNELKKYVSAGTVDYAAWKKNPKPLEAYLAQLGKISEKDYEQLPKQAQLALWINAYNAYTIKLVLDNYPIKGSKPFYPPSSIRQIDGFWEENRTTICGRSITLEGMEHDVLRKNFTDPRTHFAVVCAARGCGKIRTSAFTSAALNSQLDESKIAFLEDEDNVKIDFDKKTMKVSSIFKWFPLDFSNQVGLGRRFPPPTDDEIVATYVLRNAPQAVQQRNENAKDYKVTYEKYDWSLNESKKD